MTDNKTIAASFKLGAKLLELYNENKFKIRSYENAARAIEGMEKSLFDMAPEEIEELEGIGKNIAKKIHQLVDTGTYEELERLLDKTPYGILELIQIKGIGPKKIAQAWESLGITTPEEMLKACEKNKLRGLKGFGEKTEKNIHQVLSFYRKNKGKLILPQAEEQLQELWDVIENSGVVKNLAIVGPLRRFCPTLGSIDFQVQPLNDEETFLSFLNNCSLLTSKEGEEELKYKQWLAISTGIPVNFYLIDEKNWYRDLFFNTGSDEFVESFKKLKIDGVESEEAIFQVKGQLYLPPEMREDYWTGKEIDPERLRNLVTVEDLKGCLHNHSRYSDGANTVKEMAEQCRKLGYDYFGIADHSKAAFYANGLDEERVRSQLQEIDELNKKLAPFRIFKGIEADILNNGELDFGPDLLKELDYVVASIHTPLKMDKEKATQRLITAIENPFTTILGHMTGRLLLRREGYPIDHVKVIEACANNNVVIEINSNPMRLDIDWRWMDFALEKGVTLSINPDAHNLEGIQDMEYGVKAARKAGVPAGAILNTFALDDISGFFSERKEEAIESSHNSI